ncbi:mannosyl-3-phosphoglycerate phosphatase [Thermococcus stetteri]|uniref:mannosyl-3-phosphoglycerate phosphatase n=1 Tax=Thermococcus stetteri TaxID=49900 RepID=UPI001AE29814|nr:mannosyl-3-phosphoglycerate phosphatase [Thermococcus stetteri]MBP1912177.1 mannosyl-3-phosphoglycerate phosphatase [Thermococcus stetteri]
MSLKKVIFLDLDRTVLGDDYSPEPARGVVESLLRAGFEVVLNSSKTFSEQEYYRKAWGLEGPFIVENGSGIFIPEGYFPFEVEGRKIAGYRVIELGERYERIRKVLDGIAGEYGLKYYGNSSLEEVVTFTGLPEELARLAMKRMYSETIFRWEKEGFSEVLVEKGLKVSRGSRFVNVTGDTDKGKAAKLLLDLYSKVSPVESYAVGDGENDFPLFDVVDHAFIVGDLSHPKAKGIRDIEELLEVVG